MGRTNATYRDTLRAVEGEWGNFERALRRDDREHFQRLFEHARRYADAAGNQNPTDPMPAILLSMLLAQERERAALEARVSALERSDVPDDRLLVKNRTSKDVHAYSSYTRTVAALERASAAGLATAPGKDVEYVVVDDDAESRDRVRLRHEDGQGYDIGFYREQLVRAAESVVSPLGWRADEIEGYLESRTDGSLATYG